MKKLVQALAAIVLAAAVLYLILAPKDDENMAAFKQSAAAFLRSDRQSASLSEVLGRGGDRICVAYNDRESMEITIQDHKILTVMKGRRNTIVDGRTYEFAVTRNRLPVPEKFSGCLGYATAVLSRDSGALLLSGQLLSDDVKNSAPQKKTPAPKKPKQPKPVVKKPAPRSYGY